MADVPIYYDPDADISAEEQKRRESCSAKATFGSAEQARAAMAQAEWATGERVRGIGEYNCRFCKRWHLTRRVLE